MEELEEPIPAHVLARGVNDAPRNESTLVSRAVPGTIGPASWKDEWPRDRRGLAAWVTHPDHPLTARVAVNRLWANFLVRD